MKKWLMAMLVGGLVISVRADLSISALNTAAVIDFTNGVAGVANFSGLGFNDTGSGGRFVAGTWAARVGTDYLTWNPTVATTSTAQYGFLGTGQVGLGGIARGSNNLAGSTSGIQASHIGGDNGRILSYRTAANSFGSIFLRVQNDTGAEVNQWAVDFDAFYIDNTSVRTLIGLAYSIDDGVSFTSALTLYTAGANTAGTIDIADWTAMTVDSTTINATVAAGSDIIFRWSFGGESNAESNRAGIDTLSITAVPEPGTAALVGLGLLGCLWHRRALAA